MSGSLLREGGDSDDDGLATGGFDFMQREWSSIEYDDAASARAETSSPGVA